MSLRGFLKPPTRTVFVRALAGGELSFLPAWVLALVRELSRVLAVFLVWPESDAVAVLALLHVWEKLVLALVSFLADGMTLPAENSFLFGCFVVVGSVAEVLPVDLIVREQAGESAGLWQTGE